MTAEGISWRDFVERLNPDVHTPPSQPDTRFWPYCLDPSSSNPEPRARHPPTSSSPVFSSHSRSPSPEDDSPSASASSSLVDYLASTHAQDVADALSLAEGLLDPNAIKRLTPAQALEHPFLRDPALAREGLTERDLVPHPFGHGICGSLHWVDDQGIGHVKVKAPRKMGKRKRTEGAPSSGKRRAGGRRWDRAYELEDDDIVIVESDEEGTEEDAYMDREVAAGEGLAIGRNPCAFHRPELGYHFADS